MAITKVWIEDGCTSCGLCEDECPDVFTIDDLAEIKENINAAEFEECIKESAEGCPVEVIKFE